MGKTKSPTKRKTRQEKSASDGKPKGRTITELSESIVDIISDATG